MNTHPISTFDVADSRKKCLRLLGCQPGCLYCGALCGSESFKFTLDLGVFVSIHLDSSPPRAWQAVWACGWPVDHERRTLAKKKFVPAL